MYASRRQTIVMNRAPTALTTVICSHCRDYYYLRVKILFWVQTFCTLFMFSIARIVFYNIMWRNDRFKWWIVFQNVTHTGTSSVSQSVYLLIVVSLNLTGSKETFQLNEIKGNQGPINWERTPYQDNINEGVLYLLTRLNGCQRDTTD